MDHPNDSSPFSGDAGSQGSGNGLPLPSNGSPGAAGARPTTLEAELPALSQLQLAFRERFEALLPSIQRQWPEVARHTLEATRGSFDHAVEVISRQTGLTSQGVKQQLQELLQTTGAQAHQVADTLRPLEEQLEHLLDDLNTTLRPKLEKPVREKPLMAIGIAAGVGLVFGLLLSGRRSA
jgi:ElaB/YqjD/DUF883 family membrane-anchored ribosome-binding protein